MHADQLAATILTAPNYAAVENLARLLWRGVAENHIDDAAATRLQAAIDARRAALAAGHRKPHAGTQKPVYGAPRASRRPPLHRPEKVERRRKQAASGALPPDVAKHFTQAQNAALSVVAHQVRKTGRCALPLDKIADLAGVCRRTVKTALRLAAQIGFMSITERRVSRWRSLTNLVLVTCSEWLKWLRRPGPVAVMGGGGKNIPATITKIKNTHPNRQTSPAAPWQNQERGRRERGGWLDGSAFSALRGSLA